MKRSDTNSSEDLTKEELETLKSLLNYPSLEKLFDATDTRGTALREKMMSTIDDLERVIRRGSKEDAARAERTIDAYRTAMAFLDKLTERRSAN